MADIGAKIDYTCRAFGWSEAGYGDALGGVAQWTVSRWKHGREVPPSDRVEQINRLCFESVCRQFKSPSGFRYICNLGEVETYDAGCEERALSVLRKTMIEHCPEAPVPGVLQIIVLWADIPEGVRAQCFRGKHDDCNVYFVLVRQGPGWKRDARDEIFAHVLVPDERPKFEMKES